MIKKNFIKNQIKSHEKTYSIIYNFYSSLFILPKGRNNFQPELSLQYSTGNGNGILGLGWNLSIPNVTRKTSKGISAYDHHHETEVSCMI